MYISAFQLLLLYRRFLEFCRSGNPGIPDIGNIVVTLLNYESGYLGSNPRRSSYSLRLDHGTGFFQTYPSGVVLVHRY